SAWAVAWGDPTATPPAGARVLRQELLRLERRRALRIERQGLCERLARLVRAPEGERLERGVAVQERLLAVEARLDAVLARRRALGREFLQALLDALLALLG